ncbi:MAG: VIT1/CCC1 transporter family protein [Moraxellaceae bacterium]
MKPDEKKTASGVLDADSRAPEVLFGLIMMLTFTGTLSIADAGRDDVRAMLIGALGCNIAWGIIDGIIYLMACMAEKNRNFQAYLAARAAHDPATAAKSVANTLPTMVAAVMTQEELHNIHQRVLQLPPPVLRKWPSRQDLLGALAVCLLVITCIFPVAIPFFFVDHIATAIRISNAIAVAMLFLTGFISGGLIPQRPGLSGLTMVLLGCILVAMTIALGG